MLSIPIYKYLDTNGALATLRNQTFKWTKPSEFIAKYKDTTDMTISDIFPQNNNDIARSYKNEFVTTLLENTSHISNNGLQFLVAIIREHPNIAHMVQRELEIESEEDLFNLEKINIISNELLKAIHLALQKCRVLCMSDNILSKRMWKNYSEDEKGVAIAIRPSPDRSKDSIFNRFKPVTYSEKRPVLFTSAQDFLNKSLFENQQSMITKIIEKIMYSKTLPYSYESEYRCITVCPDDNVLEDLFIPFHPEEIISLYVGRKCEQNHRAECIYLAKRINPNICIFQVTKQLNGTISTVPILC